MANKHRTLSLVVLLGLTALGGSAAGWGLTVKACFRDANTPLEKHYCQLLEKGATLPDFYQFQQNPVATQRLLLTSPSRKYRLDLPGAGTGAQTRQRPTPPPRQATKPAATPIAENPAAVKNERIPVVAESLRGCRLEGREIACSEGRYFLQVNIPKTRLNTQVLEADNVLRLPRPDPGQDKLAYLSRSYPIYIEKMLTLGLADTTMSLTRFAAAYDEAQRAEQNFADRFAQMYELLKEDRKTLDVQTRYQNDFPEALTLCMGLTQTLIVCDNVNRNWVYRRVSR